MTGDWSLCGGRQCSSIVNGLPGTKWLTCESGVAIWNLFITSPPFWLHSSYQNHSNNPSSKSNAVFFTLECNFSDYICILHHEVLCFMVQLCHNLDTARPRTVPRWFSNRMICGPQPWQWTRCMNPSLMWSTLGDLKKALQKCSESSSIHRKKPITQHSTSH